jgi:hypothetical protein
MRNSSLPLLPKAIILLLENMRLQRHATPMMSDDELEQINGVIRMASSSMQMMSHAHPFQHLFSTLDSPPKLIYAALLILLIVYSPVLSVDYRIFADSMLGRLIGVALIYGITETMGWLYGLLTAMAFLLILHGAPRTAVTAEGFDGGGSVSEKKTVGHRWFVERVLDERTTSIATDRVTTNAITD